MQNSETGREHAISSHSQVTAAQKLGERNISIDVLLGTQFVCYSLDFRPSDSCITAWANRAPAQGPKNSGALELKLQQK